MDNLFVVPARASDGTPLIVPDPHTNQPLAVSGEFKPRSQYWLRRIADRDVIEAVPPKAPAREKAAEKSKS